MEEHENKNWGGARKGAGRPKGIKKPYAHICASVPAEYVDKLKDIAAREGLTVGKLLQIMIDERA